MPELRIDVGVKPQMVWIYAPEGKRPRKPLPVIGVVFLGALLVFLVRMSLDHAKENHPEAQDVLDSCVVRTGEAATLGGLTGNLRITACYKDSGEIRNYYLVCRMARTNSTCANQDDCWGVAVLPSRFGSTAKGVKPDALIPKLSGFVTGSLRAATNWLINQSNTYCRSISNLYNEELRPSADFSEQVTELRRQLGYR